MVSRKRANHHKQTATKNQQGRRHANPAKQKTGPEPKPNTHNNHTRFAKWHRENVPPCHHKTCTTNHWKSSSMAQLPCEYFFVRVGGSTVLSLTRGPATTGSLSATQECRDTNCGSSLCKYGRNVVTAWGAQRTYWGGPLLGVQKANVFTAPKMRLLQWPFLPKLARL